MIRRALIHTQPSSSSAASKSATRTSEVVSQPSKVASRTSKVVPQPSKVASQPSKVVPQPNKVITAYGKLFQPQRSHSKHTLLSKAPWVSAPLERLFSSASQTASINLPIGYDNFRDVIDLNLSFVDKSLFIKEFFDDSGTQVGLIIRPRRFGKSFNFSMLHHFLAAEVNGKPTQGLFDGLLIAQEGQKYMRHQGQYPVVAVSFKDAKETNFKAACANISKLMSKLYREHQNILNSPKLRDHQKRVFESVLEEKASEVSLRSSLLDLTECLHQHYEVKPMVLIDEYDTPIQAGFSQNYYDEIVTFMRTFLGAAFKSNPSLNRALMTGILRISKESLFSDLNNVAVYSLLRPAYSMHFGFTTLEVNALFAKAKLQSNLTHVQEWYNGYQAGNTVIFNPWSIVNCIKQNGALLPYWINTSDNKLIKDLLLKSSSEFKAQFEQLLQGKTIERFIDENFVFSDLEKQESVVWSLLLMTGYLRVVSSRATEQGALCQLTIPNMEVRYLYRKIIEQWLSNGYGVEWYNQFMEYLLNGQVEGIKEFLSNIMLQTISYHDTARHPEAFFHGLMIGLTASLDRQQYEIYSNRESGHGRYDILIIAKDPKRCSIILELKSIEPSKKENESILRLQKAAKDALTQIEDGEYITVLNQRGLQNVLQLGIAFSGKTVHVESKRSEVLQPKLSFVKR